MTESPARVAIRAALAELAAHAPDALVRAGAQDVLSQHLAPGAALLTGPLPDWRIAEGEPVSAADREPLTLSLSETPGGYAIDVAGTARDTATLGLEREADAIILRIYRGEQPDAKITIRPKATVIESPSEVGVVADRGLSMTPEQTAWLRPRP